MPMEYELNLNDLQLHLIDILIDDIINNKELYDITIIKVAENIKTKLDKLK